MADNMKLYNQARKVPAEAKKTIGAGRLKGFTDINPMWRIKRLTEMFGACGVGWWYTIKDKTIINDERSKQSAAFVDVELYYIDPETGNPSHAIPGTGGSGFVTQEKNGAYMSDECFKMALTDAISVAAKSIGIGADVYYEKDRDKYTFDGTPDAPPPPQTRKDDTLFKCEQCGKVLSSYPGADGKPVSIRKHAEGSKLKFGKVLCLDCIKTVNQQ